MERKLDKERAIMSILYVETWLIYIHINTHTFVLKNMDTCTILSTLYIKTQLLYIYIYIYIYLYDDNIKRMQEKIKQKIKIDNL
jgi:hypothetical protein